MKSFYMKKLGLEMKNQDKGFKYFLYSKLHKIDTWFTIKIESFEQIIKWFTIIWKQRDFDFVFLYEIMFYKIKFIKEHIENNSIEVEEGKKQRLKYIKIAYKLLDRIIKDEYDYSDDFDKAEKQYDKDKKLLFKIMYEKIDNWWE